MSGARNFKRKIQYCFIFLAMFLTAASCGARDNPDSVSDIAGETDQEASDQTIESSNENPSPADAGEGIQAVADFNYVQVGSGLAFPFQVQGGTWARMWGETFVSYAVNGEWLYVTDLIEGGEGEEGGKRAYFGVTRSRIADGRQERNYVATNVEITEESNKPLLLADRDGSCYLFWKLYDGEKGTPSYALEKYGSDGGLLWRAEPEELEEVGERLEQGTVTRGGRVILYSCGTDGCVFCFGADGSLEEVYRPKLRSLEGVAVGTDNRIYGYCVTGVERIFELLGEEGEQYDCPVTPLAVYDGYEEGLCLRTGEGMFAYGPETGETRKLWDWEDEYIQVNPNSLEQVFQDGGVFTLLCEIYSNFTLESHVVVCASVTFEDSREYPGKQAVTLATDFASTTTEFLRKLYNRQSRDYYVASVPTGSGGVLQNQLLRGEGADLMEVGRIYTGNLARQGVFEDLSPYYGNSPVVREEDILEPVREACTIGGKNVAVMPSFCIETMFDNKGYSSGGGSWTVWKFLELGEGNRMFPSQTPSVALTYCMGIRYGEHFIDYENRTCNFDGEEFRRILESCAKWETYVEYSEDGHQTSGGIGQEGCLFGTYSVRSLSDIIRNYGERCVGYPGWEDGEYPFQAYSVFAINSKSEHKDGAWDFLEYVLSEEAQTMIWQMDGLFPARIDSFEDYLQYEYDLLGSKEIKATKEDVDYVREIVGAAVYEDFGLTANPVWQIVSEEAQMYFAGNATLDGTVQKIQVRVQLYLDEL